ncbi:hypothetical protein BGW38_010137 [Lunasporangiospora selenospora]|uniref:Uncharacterized protein n=1 Tax=Lunasporangiospora selenospora TaxID=979761 RepID=A0A9P6FWY2_9FUNG|nr:hypothetical protein BGW38_010137 [Lunasporangiospora selenospora]
MKAQDAWRLAETQSPDSDAESMDGSEPEFDVEDDFGFEHADMNDNDPVSETESMGEHGDYLESDEEWDGQNNVEENDGGETLGAQIESDPQQALLIQDSDGPIHQNPSKANTSGSQNAMIESNHRAADGTWAISDEYESTTNRIACGMTSGSASGSASGSFGGTTSELSTFAEPQFQVNMQSDLEPMRFHKDKQLLIREKMDLDHVPDAHLQLQQQQYQQSQQQNQQQQLLPRQYAMSGTGNNQPSKRSGFGRRSLPKLKLILDNDQETCFNELLRWIYTDDGPRWLATFTEDNYKAIIKTVSQLRLFKISVLALLLEFESRTDPSKGLQGLAEEIFFRVKWRNA